MRRAGNGGTAAGNGTEAASSTPPNRPAAPPARHPRGALLKARAGDGTGRVAQRESTPFTRVGSQVQSLSRPPPKPQHSRGFRGSPADTPIPSLKPLRARQLARRDEDGLRTNASQRRAVFLAL